MIGGLGLSGFRSSLRIHQVPPNVGLVSEQRKRWELDSNARRSANGTALFGGSPFRMLRLSPAGMRLLDAWVAGLPTEDSPAADRLLQRVVEAGLLHPVIDPNRHGCQTSIRVGFVLPVFEDQAGVTRAVESIRLEDREATIVVVDDASPRPIEVDGATVLRHVANQGPGAARNTGVAALPHDVDVVVFVDSDVELEPACIATLLAHFDDPAVTAVAPRIRAAMGERAIDRYEASQSPLDLGSNAAVVRPGSPVPYVPSTVLAVRRSAFEAAGGFDEAMRVGEDVDLVWRLLDAGAFIRYEPAANAQHRNRASWSALARQRFGYGTAAARLDQKHPGDVAPVEIPAPMLAAWTTAALAGPVGVVAGVAIAAAEAAKLHGRLGAERHDTMSLSLLGHRHAAQWLAHAVRRAWLPVVLVAAPFSRRARRLLGASLLAGVVFDKRWNIVAGFLDDSAYCAGVWRGMWTERSARVLRPRTAARTAE